MDKRPVLVCGSLNYDFILPVERFPCPGETVLGGDLLQATGGKGANQAVQAARLGARVLMVGCVGDDFMGLALLDALKSAGVDTGHIGKSAASSTGAALITVDASGNNTIGASPGANSLCDMDYVLSHRQAFVRGGILLLQCEIPLSGVMAAIRLAREREMTVILDPAPARRLPDEIWAMCDVVKPNQTEAAFHTGVDIKSEDDIKLAAQWFTGKGAGGVIITCAEKGAFYSGGGKLTHIPARAVKAVDTTAAGDSYAGALAAALSRGVDMPGAMAYAAAAAALTVCKNGALPSLPNAAQLEEFLKEG